MLQARRGQQDNEARLRYPNRGYTRGIEQLPVVPFQDTAQAFIGSPGVLFGIPFAQENALHKTLRIPFKNPFGIHLHGAYANIIGKVVCPRHLRQIIQA